MRCAECGCDVRGGVRVILCQTGGPCCCDTIPIRREQEGSTHDDLHLPDAP